jgi:ATP-dependent Clp protease protease subunit
MEGEIQSMRISFKEAEKYNDKLFKMLGEYCGKDPEQIKLDADRDLWMDAEEALAYGIIDFIINKKKQ